MKKFIFSIAIIATALTSLTACLGDPVEVTYYDDAAITSFTLGNVKRTMHTLSSKNEDSTFVKSINCASYKFHINQITGEIWNSDSLPTNMDLTKVLCTIGAKNGGQIVVKNVDSDTLMTFSTTDSIDFSTPRVIYAYSNSMGGRRKYTATINMHKAEPGVCYWTNMVSENAAIGALTSMKAITLNNTICLYGVALGETKLYTTDINEGTAWTETAMSQALDANASKNIVATGKKVFTISDGNILASEDGISWNVIAATDMRQLVAASAKNIYALSADNKLFASADGTTWTEELLDDDAALLPTESLAFIAKPMTTNANTDRLVIIGNRDLTAFPDEATAKVWTKVEEYSDGARQQAWNFVDFKNSSRYKAPRAKNWQLITYDDNSIKAIFGKAEGTSTNSALAAFYNSSDNGMTWQKDSTLTMPKGMVSSETEFTMTRDANNMIWIICGESGQVWKGRINRVAWKKEE